MLENDSDTEVLTDADSAIDVDTEVLIESEAITLSISRVALECISGNPLLVTIAALVDAEADALVLAEADALVDAEADALVDAEADA
ncbi:MAG: hypothetical protein E6578_05435, partial [Streptococcus mitis]|nr:hypothetical protein [Streptococcus mitis]